MSRGIVLAVLLLLLATSVIAANDPGHDSLYVLKFGDSNIVGNLNITQTLNATNVRAAALLYGDQLDIRANGTILSVSSRPAIQADSSNLYLDATGSMLINTLGGTTGVVQIGPRTGSAITLNVSGTIKQQNINVCLEDGTSCPVMGGASSSAGWTNTSTNTTTALNVIVNTGSVIFQGMTGTTPASGPGTRFMWIPSKGAIRAGSVEGTEWDNTSIGRNSTAFGAKTIASGDQGATAMGVDTVASGDDGATALGSGTIANGSNGATAMGYYTISNGTYGAAAFGEGSRAGGTHGSFAAGEYTVASGTDGATAFGESSVASGTHGSFAAGGYTIANGTYGAAAFGEGSVASGTHGSFAAGEYTVANGTDGATAFGEGSRAGGTHGSFAAGEYTVASGATGATALGTGSAATGSDGATALGGYTVASGNYGATALGSLSIASGHYGATALGFSTRAAGNTSVAIGGGTATSHLADYAVSIGSGIFNSTLGASPGAYLNNTIRESLIIGFNSTTPTVFVNGSSVGIGTVTPTQKLDVNGSINVSTAGYIAGSQICTATNGLCAAAGGSAGGWLNTTHQVHLNNNATNVSIGYNASAPNLYVDNSNARVGIGTNTPFYKMDVSQDAGVTSGEKIIAVYGRPAGTYSGFVLGYRANGTADNGAFIRSNNGVPLVVGSSGYPTAMTITSSGNIGILTSAPLQNFTVNGSANITGQTYLGNTRCSASEVLTTDASTGLISCTTVAAAGSGGGWLNSTTQVYLSNNATNISIGSIAGAPMMFVDNTNGRVQLANATSNSASLSIKGGTNRYAMALQSSVVGEAASWINWHDATGSMRWQFGTGLDNAATYSFGLYDVTNGKMPFFISMADDVSIGNTYINATLTVLAAGRVGIGTSAPNKTLDVNGTSRFAGNQTFALPASDNEVCFERFVGTTQNYTRCINSTGQVTERFGAFPIN